MNIYWSIQSLFKNVLNIFLLNNMQQKLCPTIYWFLCSQPKGAFCTSPPHEQVLKNVSAQQCLNLSSNVFPSRLPGKRKQYIGKFMTGLNFLQYRDVTSRQKAFDRNIETPFVSFQYSNTMLRRNVIRHIKLAVINQQICSFCCTMMVSVEIQYCFLVIIPCSIYANIRQTPVYYLLRYQLLSTVTYP